MVMIVVASDKTTEASPHKERHDELHHRVHRDVLNILRSKGIRPEDFTPEAFEDHYATHYKSHHLYPQIAELRKAFAGPRVEASEKGEKAGKGKKLFHTSGWHRKALTRWEKALKEVKSCEEHCDKELDNMPKEKKKHFEKMRKVRDAFTRHAEEEIKFHKIMIENL